MRNIRVPWACAALGAVALGLSAPAAAGVDGKHTIGATAQIVVRDSGATLRARVDTGAHTCSIDARDIDVAGAAADPRDEIGKAIRFRGRDGTWTEAVVAGAATVRTADGRTARRYEVDLVLQWGAVEKQVRVTLNDRSDLTYPMLVGRNFLLDDIVVDVSLDPGED